MFRCAFCHQSSLPYEKLVLVVMQTREVNSPEGRLVTQTVSEKPKCGSCAGTRSSMPEGAVSASAEIAA